MIIYKFTTWGTKRDELFVIEEVEVEEKTKIYVGNHTRINKNDIGVLNRSLGMRMYLLDKNPAPYIAAIKERYKMNISAYEARVAGLREELAKWEALSE